MGVERLDACVEGSCTAAGVRAAVSIWGQMSAALAAFGVRGQRRLHGRLGVRHPVQLTPGPVRFMSAGGKLSLSLWGHSFGVRGDILGHSFGIRGDILGHRFGVRGDILGQRRQFGGSGTEQGSNAWPASCQRLVSEVGGTCRRPRPQRFARLGSDPTSPVPLEQRYARWYSFGVTPHSAGPT